MGGLLDAVSLALRDVDQVQLTRLPRMADFAIWSVAAAPALGFSQEAFVDTYSTNRNSANGLTLESSTLVPALRAMVAHKGEWMGSATDLLGELDKRADERTKHQKSWPANARVLSNTLRRLTHNLRVDGIDVTFDLGRNKARRRIISITQVEGIYHPPASNRPTEGMPDTNPGQTADAKPNYADANDAGSVHTSVRNSVSEKSSSDAADDTDARIPTLSKDVVEVE